MEIPLKFTIPKKFRPLLKHKHRFEILKGGAGSGKSYNTAQKILIRAISEPNHRFLILRKVQRTIRESVFELFKKLIVEVGLPPTLYKINKSELSITFWNNSKLIFSGLDDPEKIKSITNITSIWAEEATEFTQEDILQLNLRLRPDTGHFPQITLTLNPVSSKHWIKKFFFDERNFDPFLHHSTYLDNPYLSNDYKKSFDYLKDANPTYYKIYALGEWGTLEGLIYEYELIDELPKYAEIDVLGLDFGFNHPQSLVRVKIEGRNAYIDEIYYQTNKTNKEMMEYLEQNEPELMYLKCWADSARPDLIDECSKAGMDIEPAMKDVFAGINAVKEVKLHITKRSVNLIKEIEKYVWKVDKDGNTLDEPIKRDDDGMDAMRYAIFSEMSQLGEGAVVSFRAKGV